MQCKVSGSGTTGDDITEHEQNKTFSLVTDKQITGVYSKQSSSIFEIVTFYPYPYEVDVYNLSTIADNCKAKGKQEVKTLFLVLKSKYKPNTVVPIFYINIVCLINFSISEF